jgi:hypothetical protein
MYIQIIRTVVSVHINLQCSFRNCLGCSRWLPRFKVSWVPGLENTSPSEHSSCGADCKEDSVNTFRYHGYCKTHEGWVLVSCPSSFFYGREKGEWVWHECMQVTVKLTVLLKLSREDAHLLYFQFSSKPRSLGETISNERTDRRMNVWLLYTWIIYSYYGLIIIWFLY